MDLPKCKICGERHRLGPCNSDGGVEGHAPVEEVWTATATGSAIQQRAKQRAEVGIKPGTSGAKFDRVAYQREYMRKRRAKSGGPED